jgi:hypothetical protein
MRCGASSFALPLLALVLAACGDRRTVDKPTPPDMSAVVASYEAPDGVFDQASARAALDAYAARLASVEELGLHDEVIDSIREGIAEALEESAASSSQQTEPGVSAQALSLDANGTMSIRRICAGWGPEPVADEANGNLSLRVNFSESGLDPVIWGDADACRYLVGGIAEISIDEGSGRTPGDVRAWLGRSASFDDFGNDPIIFDVDLDTAVEGVAAPVVVNFRVDPAALSLAFAVDVLPGKVVVSLDDVSGTLSVVAQNGSFECDLVLGQCTSETGQSFSF